MRRIGWSSAIAGIAICSMALHALMASRAWSQEPTPARPADQPPPPLAVPSPGPSLATYPVELLGLLAPPPQRGPVTLMPSISVSEEYNDNIFLDNQNRQWDLITGFSPAITLLVNDPTYQLSAGYTFTAEVYERESRLTNALSHQTFLVNGLYRATRSLSLTAADSYALDRDTSRVASQGFASGRQESWRNTFTPGLAWQMTPRASLSLGATYSVLRFEGEGSGVDSDTYGMQGSLGYALTPRLTGTAGYGFTYLNFQEGDAIEHADSATHNPTLGLSYRLTPTLTGSVSGGPAITELGGETFVSPAGAASLVQTLAFGSASLHYTRKVDAAGGLGGTTDTQSVSGALTVSSVQRGLLVVFSPLYSTAESVSREQPGRVDVRLLTLNLGVTYQLARFVSVFAQYAFLQQRTGGASSVQADADQNRVKFGLQFGYPINFD